MAYVSAVVLLPYFVNTNSQLLGASTVFMEFYYVLNAVWKYKVFCAWTPLLISLVLLTVVVSCSTITAIYFRLSEENHSWQWPSFICPFGVSAYLFAYSAYFYNVHIVHDTVLQAIYFFASSSLMCLVVGAISGFVGFMSAVVFVRIMFRDMKTD